MKNTNSNSVDLPLINGMRKQFFELGFHSVKDVPSDGSGKNTLGRMTAGVMNLAFACELSLKQLASQKDNKSLTGHSLSLLFNKLNPQIREQIEIFYCEFFDVGFASLTNPPSFYLGSPPKLVYSNLGNFKVSIQEHNTYFVKYRYYFELDKLEVDDNFGNKTMHYQFEYRFLYLFYNAANRILEEV